TKGCLIANFATVPKIEKFGANAPLGRPGQPVEIAPLYVTLAAEENSYTSGQVWCSDGGTGTL
ncbi:SDR family oxidoreductase, partial [Escherichia coli]|nr:SDR family oxidoreductase [Escherichia coli]